MADKDVADCAMDVLLGDPSQLPSLDVKEIIGLDQSVVLRHYQEVSSILVDRLHSLQTFFLFFVLLPEVCFLP